LSAGQPKNCLQGFLAGLLGWALNECVDVAQTYENLRFHIFLRLSVEIIEEKNGSKVIHSPCILDSTQTETRQFGRTQVVQINI
jgi:hypothetical protein